MRVDMTIKHEIASSNPEADFSRARAEEIFKKIKQIRAIPKRDKKAMQFMQAEVKGMREELKYILGSAYLATFVHKYLIFEYILDDVKLGEFRLRQDKEDVKKYLTERYAEFVQARNIHRSEIQESRKQNRSIRSSRKENLGYTYMLDGGDVFTKPKSVLALQSMENQLSRISKAKKPSDKDPNNFVGIELELVGRVDRKTLNDLLCKAYLAGYVYLRDDSSIQRENPGDYAHEITVLCRERQLVDVVNRLCKVINSKEVEAYVNNSCGLHIHIDCRNRDPKHLYNNLTRCLPMLKNMVPQNRVESEHATRYCKLNTTSKWEEQNHGDRYMAVNSAAYTKYKTIEVRMHSGTTNATKIIYWAKILLAAAHHKDLIKSDIGDAYKFNDVVGCDSKIMNYIIKRTSLFLGKMSKAFDTRYDHYSHNEEEQVGA